MQGAVMNQANDSTRHSPGPDSPGPGSDVSDVEAIEAVFAGDTEAFGVIVRRYQSAICAYQYKLLGNSEDAEDATQETFVKAYTNLGRYNPARPFQPWLFRIARNTAISHQRRAGRRSAIPLSDDHRDAAPTARHIATQSQVQAQLDAAVFELPPDSRELFELRYRQELSVEEISNRVGRRPNTISVALHRLRLRLRGIVFGEDAKHTPKENQP